MPGKFFVGVSILIEKEGKILVAKRSRDRDYAPGIWEIPAGRLENGESPEDALKREALEELGVEIEPLFPYNSYFFYRGKKSSDNQIVIISYACKIKKGTPQKSKEHEEIRWVAPEEFYRMAKFKLQKEDIKRYIELKKKFKNSS